MASVQDIESIATRNEDFRRVLYTAQHCPLVVMALKPQEEIGAEVHKLDQFFRVEQGTGEAAQALHDLLSAQPSRWRVAPHALGRRRRH